MEDKKGNQFLKGKDGWSFLIKVEQKVRMGMLWITLYPLQK